MSEHSPCSALQPLLVRDLEATLHRFTAAFNLRFQPWTVTTQAGLTRSGYWCRQLTRGIQPVVLLQALPHEIRHPLDLTVLHASPSAALQQALAAGFLPVKQAGKTGISGSGSGSGSGWGWGLDCAVASVRDPDDHLMVDIEAAFETSTNALP